MATIGTNLGLTYAWNLGENNWKTGMDANLKNLDTLVQANVKGFQTAPPGSPTTGDTYLTGNGCTGAWSGNDQKIARWNGAAWEFITPKTGWVAARDTDTKIFTKNVYGWDSKVFADAVYGDVSLTIAAAYQFSSSGDSALLFSGGGGAAADMKFVSTGRLRWHTDLYLSRSTTKTLRISSDGSTGAAHLDVRGAVTIGTNLTVSGLTAGRLPTLGTGGLFQSDAGLTFAQTSSVTNSLVVGDGAVAATAFFAANAAADQQAALSLRSAGTSRWSVSRLATSLDFAIIARDSGGAEIDQPINIVNAANGVITIGGGGRPTNFNAEIRVGGTAVISAARAITCTGITITGATAGQGTYVGAGGVVTADAGFTLAQSSGITVTQILGNGSVASNVAFALRGAAARRRIIGFQTGTSDRWVFGADATAESGSNNGTNLVIEAYTDAGAPIDTPLTINRVAGGAATWTRRIVFKPSTTGNASCTFQIGAAPSAPNDGDVWYDSTTKSLGAYTNGLAGFLSHNIYSQYVATTRAGVVSQQSLSGTARGSRALPAGFLNVQGKKLRYRLCGIYSTDAVPGTAEIRIRLGSTTFRTTGTFNLDASITNGWWRLEGEITCYTTGASGTLHGMMGWEHQASAIAGSEVIHLQPATTTGTVTLDLTAAQTFDVDWTASDSGTTITCTCFSLFEEA